MKTILTGFDVPVKLSTRSEAAGMKSPSERQAQAKMLIRHLLEVGENFFERDFEKAIENGEFSFALHGTATLDIEPHQVPLILALPMDNTDPESITIWNEYGDREFTVDRLGAEFESSPVADIVTVNYSRYAIVKLRSMLIGNEGGALILEYSIGACYRRNG